VQIALAKRPLEEPYCGDQAAWWELRDTTLLCIVDGLGHGRGAQRAAMAALDFVARRRHEPLPEIFTLCDEALRHTRGVAMSIAVADPRAGMLTYAGIGNIRARVIGERNRSLSGNYGIVGGGYRRLTPETVSLAPDDLVILATDGVRENFDVCGYDNEILADVTRLGERVLMDWRRETDDAAVLVFRTGGEA